MTASNSGIVVVLGLVVGLLCVGAMPPETRAMKHGFGKWPEVSAGSDRKEPWELLAVDRSSGRRPAPSVGGSLNGGGAALAVALA